MGEILRCCVDRLPACSAGVGVGVDPDAKPWRCLLTPRACYGLAFSLARVLKILFQPGKPSAQERRYICGRNGRLTRGGGCLKACSAAILLSARCQILKALSNPSYWC